MVQLVWRKVLKVVLVLAVLLDANADFILNQLLILFDALRQNIMAFFEFLCFVVALCIFIQGLFQLFQRFLQLLDLNSMRLRLFLVLIEEQVKINDLIEVKSAIVLDQLLFLNVKIYSIQLEKHDVWRSADPGLQNLRLSLNISFVSFNF